MNIINSTQHQLMVRLCFRGALININGQTFDCDVHRDKCTGQFTASVDGNIVCEWYEWHMDPVGYYVPATMFQICESSHCGGDATLDDLYSF